MILACSLIHGTHWVHQDTFVAAQRLAVVLRVHLGPEEMVASSWRPSGESEKHKSHAPVSVLDREINAERFACPRPVLQAAPDLVAPDGFLYQLLHVKGRHVCKRLSEFRSTLSVVSQACELWNSFWLLHWANLLREGGGTVVPNPQYGAQIPGNGANMSHVVCT